MKFESFEHGYACQHRTVVLEGEERDWCDNRIITAADRHGVCTGEDWQKIEDGAHPGHFGGRVERFSTISPGNKVVHRANVTVYID
jgi:hypothetical protein